MIITAEQMIITAEQMIITAEQMMRTLRTPVATRTCGDERIWRQVSA
jgi:hypothetical protein